LKRSKVEGEGKNRIFRFWLLTLDFVKFEKVIQARIEEVDLMITSKMGYFLKLKVGFLSIFQKEGGMKFQGHKIGD